MDFFFNFSFLTGFLIVFVMGIIKLVISDSKFYNNKIYKVIASIGLSFLGISLITFLVRFKCYVFIAFTLIGIGVYIILKSENK